MVIALQDSKRQAMNPTDEYQQRAEDCLRLVRLMPTELDRRTMLLAARRWQALAGQARTGCVAGGLAAEPARRGQPAGAA
jgi:hypothetical protein